MKPGRTKTRLNEPLLHALERQDEQQQCKDTFWPCAFNLAKVVTGAWYSSIHVRCCQTRVQTNYQRCCKNCTMQAACLLYTRAKSCCSALRAGMPGNGWTSGLQ
jgi:hypothetical protein